MLSVVMVSGLFLASVGIEVAFASHDDSKKGNANAGGCTNSNNDKMKTKNKHCDDDNGGGNGGGCEAGTDPDGDGICGADDECPNLFQVDPRDHDGDGVRDNTDPNPCDANIP